MKTMLTMIALAATLALMPVSTAGAAETTTIEDLAATLATTPEQHQAVAAYYRGKAEEAREEAARHRKMAATYGGGKYVQKKAMEDHCAKLSASYTAVAEQYDALAAEHEASAK